MNDLSCKIGKKVKKLRVARGMTQSALAGDYMTRNMLSRIENGAALPSLPTVCYLADRLSINAGYFFSDNADFFEMKRDVLLPKMRELFKARDFSALYLLYRTEFSGECDDEIAFFLSHASLYEAKRLFRAGNLLSAGEELRAAESFLQKTGYPTEDLRAELLLYSAVIENVAAPRLALDDEAYRSFADPTVDREFFAYITEDAAYPYTTSFYERHLSARAWMKKGAFSDALAVLNALEDEKSESNLSSFLLFRIYSDIEVCHKELRNFEAAYRYATRRMSLLSSFRT